MDSRAFNYVDLESTVHQLRLDTLAKKVSEVLEAAGVPHALLKGPTTANWLYEPPRPYRDVDLLIPETGLKMAVHALSSGRLAKTSAGGLGEEAAHSLVMVSAVGFEIDLHISLPMLSPYRYRESDELWGILAEHLTTMTLFPGATVPVLDIPGRCLVLALHAVASGHENERVREDLRRARSQASRDEWQESAALAGRLGIGDLFGAGIAIIEPGWQSGHLPVDAYLKHTKSVGSAFALQRLVEAPLSAKASLLWRELFPTIGFVRHAHPVESRTVRGLVGLYVRRWRRIAHELPSAAMALRAARSQLLQPPR